MNQHWRAKSAASATAPSAPARSIVFLGTAHDNGGSSILAGNLAAEMRAHGHHVEEWYLFGSPAALPAGARVFAEGARRASPVLLFKLFVQIVRALRASKADVVIGLQPLSNLIAGVGGKLAGIENRIATLHNPANRFNPVLMALDRVAGALGFYRHIVACSNSVAASFARHEASYRRRMVVVANGHAAPALVARSEARRRLGLPESGVVIGQLGRLSEQKNQAFSLDLLCDLPGATLLMVGIGPDAATLRAKIARDGLAERVRMRDAVDHSQIGDFYSAIDLMLFPSRFEGLSLAAIEAIHAGVPLLCSDIPSFREMFADSNLLSATLLAPLDRAQWLARIHALLDDEALRAEISAELRRLSPAFTFERMADGYLRLLD